MEESPKQRIYSDFNGPYQPDFMLLTYHGTQKDLDKLGIVLKEGMLITVYDMSDEEKDIEIDGTVVFGVIPNTDEKPCWYMDSRGNELRYVRRK